MLEVSLNGKILKLEYDMSVQEFLASLGFDMKFIALERDGEILAKTNWQDTMMSGGKRYEVVEFVGGG
ncbi:MULTISPECIES: sulfur carrier protein ThiS [Campylobacter]|uniref:Thiamin biosynthesis protein n=1 Tax=Campylobacter curvus (strain 525.92) TaxID=360105 RepID=A7GYH1_CAMC5|nr:MULTISPECIES: sulfur carrier protein ThiS [Campylobacter]EAU00095.1 thiamin biosynthesis protein [Campylobacter curvus 525.92]EJP75263.1 thiamine biosynthesis protein ThiS [Campylobacter sp. FOBRC14]